MKKSKNLITFITAFFISLLLISTAVNFTLNFKPLYYFDIGYLNIEKDTGLTKEQIKKDYSTLINYLSPYNKEELSFENFPMSREGKIHFQEVKEIFIKTNYLLGTSLLLAIAGAIYLIKNKNYSFIKLSSYLLLVLPLTLALPFAINFDSSFTTFHKIFFRNDYWLFDPLTDGIINALPQDFFFHSAVLILVILCAFSSILFYLHKKLKKN